MYVIRGARPVDAVEPRDDSKREDRSGCCCGCGCWTILMEIVAFILICDIFGCKWSLKATHRIIDEFNAETNSSEISK